MPAVFPFRAVTYRLAPGTTMDLSEVVAPPYDVLDVKGKAALLARDERNIVAADLPHIPAKELGPAQAYSGAAAWIQERLREGTLARMEAPAMFVYRETFTFAGKVFKRSGMACALEVKPFGARPGGGILPHEETFSGPKADRLALMKATRMQLSAIFGLHQDETGKAARLMRDICATRAPEMQGTTPDGTLHEVWIVRDPLAQQRYQEALRGEDVFIADGHHRYNTALNYLAEREQAGTVGPEDGARRCMFVLISMGDPGTVIGPTHRVLGGMSGYSLEAFERAAAGLLKLTPAGSGEAALRGLEEKMGAASARAGGLSTLGVYDFASGACFTAQPTSADPLAAKYPERTPAWRTLDVALIQEVVVEQICKPALNAGAPVKWGFPHSIDEVVAIGAGAETGAGGGAGFVPQVAVIVRPTPLEAVRAVSRAGQLMPQKSTFFFPKVATGLFMSELG